MSTENKFEGWAAVDNTAIKGNLKWIEYTPKKLEEDDVEVKILYAGICGSDLHTISEGWADMTGKWPQIVGHEIVGEVVKAGSKVTNIKPGDVVGIGAQCDSCLSCEQCHEHRENYCNTGVVGTYNSKYYRGDKSKGDKTWGGYANFWRGPAHFAIRIPDSLDKSTVAPMLCAGGTVWSPLTQNGAGTTAKNVGVVGIGGLGHFAILFAKALGANVTAISHGSSKVKDAKEMGATDVIVTGNDAAAAVKGRERSLDLIVSTSNDPKLPVEAYLSLLKPTGKLVFVGLPDGGVMPSIPTWTMIMNNVSIGASLIASPAELQTMLDFAAEHQIKPWIQKFPMDDVNKAIVSMHNGDARYRYVLVNTANGAKL